MPSDPDVLSAGELLAELDRQVGVGRRPAILEEFAAAVDPLMALLGKVHGPSRTSGHLTVAICQNLARGITDLLAGVHLTSHCYLAQSYAVMRPVYEVIDLLDLFVDQPAEAELWTTTEEGYKHFTPAKVRQKLGRPTVDPMHDHFTERGSHPRFAAAKLSSVMYGPPGETPSVHITIGPFGPVHPATLHPFTHAYVMLGALSFRGRHLEAATASVSWQQWLEAHIAVTEGICAGLVTVEAELCRRTRQPEQTLLADACGRLLNVLRVWQAEGTRPAESALAALEPDLPG